MDTYHWNDYNGSKLKKVVDHLIKESLTNLLSLSQDQCLMTEIAIFRKNLEKICIRLRNSKISSLLRKIRRLINLYLELNIPEVLEKECKAFLCEKYDGTRRVIELPKGDNVINVMKELRNLADILDKICKYSSYSVSHCMLWLRLGHMIPHFVVSLSTISRLNIICRALLIYVADLYGGLIEFCKLCKDNQTLDENEIQIPDGPLKDLEPKSLDKLGEEEGQDMFMIEDIGQVISREDKLIKKLVKPKNTSDSRKLSTNLSKIRIVKRKRAPTTSIAKYTSIGVLHILNRQIRIKKAKEKVELLFSQKR